MLKGKSNRNALRFLNDLSLIVSLNHVSGFSGEGYVDKAQTQPR